jgi:hypothetical protein
MTDVKALNEALDLVSDEYIKARRKHSPMASGHEGYAVIKEELDELWDEIKANRGDSIAALEEATQVAAMAVAYMIEIAGAGR